MSKTPLLLYSYVVLCVLLLLPATVKSECTCEPDDMTRDSKSITLKYKVGAIGAILGAGAFGVGLPLLGKRVSVLRPENDIFFMIKAFAAGVILATGFIHILPEAFEGLTSPCIGETPWQKFPFAAFVAMVASIGSLMVDSLATGHYRRVHFGDENDNVNGKVVDEERNNDENVGHVHVHTHATHGHSHGHGGGGSLVGEGEQLGEQLTKLQLIRHRVTAQVNLFALIKSCNLHLIWFDFSNF